MIDLDIISYNKLAEAQIIIEKALLDKGIIGISDVPNFENSVSDFIKASRQFAALPEEIKTKYIPNRDAGFTEGYELGAEKFQDQNGHWHVDDKKSSYYALIPNHLNNKWPDEVDLKTPYLALGSLIFATGKRLLHAIGLNEKVNLDHNMLIGHGRMLHYQSDEKATNKNWCGAHFDHGLFTGLIPAHYFCDGNAIDEPDEAGLYIKANHHAEFEKISANDKSILLFQVGEFAQLMLNDRIKATKHLVRKAKNNIERFTFALFYSPADQVTIQSNSQLIADLRYQNNQSADGSINYGLWQEASYERYRAR